MNPENTPTIAIIDYGMGNLRSVAKAFEHVGANVQIITCREDIGHADALVLPGVGALGDCVDALKREGLADTISGWIREDRPFFGICLGLQALFEYSEEGKTQGLGVFPGKVLRFQRPSTFKIPHMGWNSAHFTKESAMTGEIVQDEQFYFVHSYYVCPEEDDLIWCTTDYGGEFTSGIAQGNCFATQFHPEKSQAQGLQIYNNFVQWVSGPTEGLLS